MGKSVSGDYPDPLLGFYKRVKKADGRKGKLKKVAYLKMIWIL